MALPHSGSLRCGAWPHDMYTKKTAALCGREPTPLRITKVIKHLFSRHIKAQSSVISAAAVPHQDISKGKYSCSSESKRQS
jgi:hypothetical protein